LIVETPNVLVRVTHVTASVEVLSPPLRLTATHKPSPYAALWILLAPKFGVRVTHDTASVEVRSVPPAPPATHNPSPKATVLIREVPN
jgi:hypothetical protein